MDIAQLDSRIGLGTDIEQRLTDSPSWGQREPRVFNLYPLKQEIRVIVGYLGDFIRMSAPSLDVVVEGDNKEEVWQKFLDKIRAFENCAWLRFDIGPTRPEEIDQGLNIPEDEDWSGLMNDNEA